LCAAALLSGFSAFPAAKGPLGRASLKSAGDRSLALPDRAAPKQALASQHPAFAPAMPFVFEKNVGQTPGPFKFLAHGHGYSLGLTNGAAVMSLASGLGGGKRSEMTIRPLGGNPNPVLSGADRQSAVANYFVGNDQRKWLKGVPMFGGARYKSVYPGIDMVYRGNEGQLEYDFVLAPGADPARISVAYEGARSLRVDRAGDLLIRTGSGEIRQKRPYAYQTIRDRRRAVAAGYRVQGTAVSVHLGPYDRARQLIIDPIVNYGSYIGGNDIDEVNGVAVDPEGMAYVVGNTRSSDFPNPQSQPKPVASPTPFDPNKSDNSTFLADSFVAKFDMQASGSSSLKYVTFVGGNGNEAGKAIAVDSHQNVFFAGITESSDFPSLNAFQGPSAGSWGFVAQLDSAGTLAYASRIGYNRQTVASGIAVHEAAGVSYAYVTGFTTSDGKGTPDGRQATFPDGFATEGAYRAARTGSASASDAFLVRVNPALSGTASLVYATYLGGNEADGNGEQGGQVAVDQTGVAYVVSAGESTDFPGTLPPSHQNRLFVAKLSGDGKNLLQARSYGRAKAGGIVTGAGGSVYVTGSTDDAAFNPGGTPGFQPKHGPNLQAGSGVSLSSASDAFVLRVSSDLSPAAFTFLGGNEEDYGAGIALDKAGNVYVTGSTASSDFPRTQGPPVSCPGDLCSFTAFLTKLSPDLGKLGYSALFTSGELRLSANNGSGIAVTETPTHGIVVAGSSGPPHGSTSVQTQELPVSPNAYQRSPSGKDDGFITRWGVPTVTGVSQICGPVAGGTPVIITGRDFAGLGPTGLADGVTEVKFGDALLAKGAGYVVTSDTSITAVTPPHPPAAVHVTVANGLGSSPASEDAVFTYPCPVPIQDPSKSPAGPSNPPPAAAGPVVARLDPSAGPLEGGTKVRITGSGLTGAKTVRFGEALVGVHPCPVTGGTGKAPCFSEQSANEILAFSPAAKSAASVHVTVETERGLSAPTAADLFDYQEGAVPAKADLKSDPVGGHAGNRPAISVPVSNTTSYVPGPPGGSAAFVASPSVTTAPALSSGFSSAVSASVAESSSAVSMNAGAISFVPESSPEERAAPSAADTYNMSASRHAASLLGAGACFAMVATVLGRRRRWATRPDAAAPAFARAI